MSLKLSLLAVQLRGEIEPCRFSLRLSLLAVQLRGEIGAPSQYETAGKTLVEFAWTDVEPLSNKTLFGTVLAVKLSEST